MDLLRNLRLSTRLLFLYEVTTSRHSRLRTIAERLGMTVQGASEYAHGLEADGLLSLVEGEYRATKKGVEFLHDRLRELRDFVDRARKEMAFVETTAALAATSIPRGARVGLFMEEGILVAHLGRASPSSGVAVRDAPKGEIVSLQDLEGIVALRPGRIVIGRIRAGGLGRKGSPTAAAARIVRRLRHPVVAAFDVVGVVAAKELGLKPRIEFGVLPATVEAAERGLDVILLLPEERAGEAIRAIEAANAKLEDQIPFESVTLG
jgi:predicted transcriptional regulator